MKEIEGNIYLIGFMASGKSTVASRLSEITGLPVLEMDKEIELRAGMPISDIFQQYGEDHFRELETNVLTDLASKHAIVSCGGGTPLREVNRKLMRECGRIVYLSVTPETVVERLNVNQSDRPVLKGHVNVKDISEILKKRDPIYRELSEFIIPTDGRSVEEICTQVLLKLQ